MLLIKKFSKFIYIFFLKDECVHGKHIPHLLANIKLKAMPGVADQ